MLRISVLHEPGIARLKLEGKLAHDWVNEVRGVWLVLSKGNASAEIVVDLLDVSFVDDAGRRLLAEMRHGDAELIGAGPLMSALIEEIEDAEAATAPDGSAEG